MCGHIGLLLWLMWVLLHRRRLRAIWVLRLRMCLHGWWTFEVLDGRKRKVAVCMRSAVGIRGKLLGSMMVVGVVLLLSLLVLHGWR